MKRNFAYFLIMLAVLSSCGSSVISLSEKNSNYSIYIDKVYAGKNGVRIQRSGLPQSKMVVVKDATGSVIAHEKIRRDFNFFKFLAGFYYLFPLWFFSWQYDKNIEIYIEKPHQKNSNSWTNDSTYKSPWD